MKWESESVCTGGDGLRVGMRRAGHEDGIEAARLLALPERGQVWIRGLPEVWRNNALGKEPRHAPGWRRERRLFLRDARRSAGESDGGPDNSAEREPTGGV